MVECGWRRALFRDGVSSCSTAREASGLHVLLGNHRVGEEKEEGVMLCREVTDLSSLPFPSPPIETVQCLTYPPCLCSPKKES